MTNVQRCSRSTFASRTFEVIRKVQISTPLCTPRCFLHIAKTRLTAHESIFLLTITTLLPLFPDKESVKKKRQAGGCTSTIYYYSVHHKNFPGSTGTTSLRVGGVSIQRNFVARAQ